MRSEGSTGTMIKNYNGSPLERLAIKGLEYCRTTHEYGGMPQTMLVARKDGNKITLTLVGKDYQTNEDLKKILKSIEIK